MTAKQQEFDGQLALNEHRGDGNGENEADMS
jgi:hypothetical protein